MPTELELPVLLLVAAAAAGAALAVFHRTEARGSQNGAGNGPRASQAHRPGLLAWLADIVDASIGMYVLRRALGRPTSTRAEGRAERARRALAAADEDARRAGPAGPAIVAPTRLVVAGTAASHTPHDLPDRQAHPVAAQAVRPPWTRRSAVSREGAFAAAGLAVVLIAAFVILPRNEGGVASATGTPAPPSPTADSPSPTPLPTESATPAVTPTVVVSAAPEATPTPTAAPTPTPTTVPRPTPAAAATIAPTAAPTATRTPGPTARPTATATPRPTPPPTPTPTATAAATASSTAAPTATAIPTAPPTPPPTPGPTPTAEPTPQPTPEPTP